MFIIATLQSLVGFPLGDQLDFFFLSDSVNFYDYTQNGDFYLIHGAFFSSFSRGSVTLPTDGCCSRGDYSNFSHNLESPFGCYLSHAC